MGSPRTLTKKQILDTLAKTGDLSGADLRGCDLSGICFDGANLQRAKLAESTLARSTFRKADLSYASLWQCDCQDAVFDGAILEETDFDFAHLDGCTFLGARIRKTVFPFSQLPLEEIKRSVRTGRKVRMSPVDHDE